MNIFKNLIKSNKENVEINNLEDDNSAEAWFGGDYNEGQLSIDVFQTDKNIVIKSTIAGVRPDDLDISLNNDMLTIRGSRQTDEEIEDENYLCRECYWGAFSRSVILPCEVKADKIEALLENGVLTVILPKVKIVKQAAIRVKEI